MKQQRTKVSGPYDWEAAYRNYISCIEDKICKIEGCEEVIWHDLISPDTPIIITIIPYFVLYYDEKMLCEDHGEGQALLEKRTFRVKAL